MEQTLGLTQEIDLDATTPRLLNNDYRQVKNDITTVQDLSMTGVGAGENQIELGGGYSQRDQTKIIEKEEKFDGLVGTKTFTR